MPDYVLYYIYILFQTCVCYTIIFKTSRSPFCTFWSHLLHSTVSHVKVQCRVWHKGIDRSCGQIGDDTSPKWHLALCEAGLSVFTLYILYILSAVRDGHSDNIPTSVFTALT